MDKLKLPTLAGRGSPGSPRGSVTVRRNPNDPLPKISNPSTDVDIPRSVWSAWKEDGKPQQLRRPLTTSERAQLEARRDDLAPALAPFRDTGEGDAVALALTGMFGSFRSMRQSGDEAFAILDGARQALARFPGWAIVKVCASIQENGVWRDGKFDRQWAPNDSEIVAAVRTEIAHYERVHRSAVDLLTAAVEPSVTRPERGQ